MALHHKLAWLYSHGVEDRALKKLVLAEKPSVGRELARVLKCWKRETGYLEGDDYIVTWALGHLVELAEPAAYSDRYRRWSLSDLPMLPAELKQEVIEQSKDQFAIVSSLLNRADVESLVIATDAGREGELVARWIMKLANYTGQAKRLWISSQTEGAIKEGFANLKDAKLYDNLYEAAQSRAAADWYVGMNVTRALTCHYDAKLSAGRVQTPTLALMTMREDEIEAFSGQFYWTLKADFSTFSASYYPSEDSIRITSEDEASRLETLLVGKKGKIVSVQTAERSEQPPLAYDLTELQRDANNLLDFSAKETLDTLQSLYEQHKIVTYPRTDSRYITTDIVSTLPQRLQSLIGTPFTPMVNRYLNEGFRVDEDRFVQDLQVTDHHAIIPTEQRVDLGRLNTRERALWELIVVRFLEVLSPDYTYRTTTVQIEVEQCLFKTRLTIGVNQGWRDVARLVGKRSAQSSLSDEEEASPALLGLSEGDEFSIASVKVRRLATTAPSRYTEATLLSAMEHAGRFVEDAKLKKRLGNGLGTPATRADIIEKLIQNHYVQREGKELVPTAKGRELVRLSPQELRSPELTGVWEERLGNIADGIEDSKRFIQDIKTNAARLVDQVKTSGEVFSPHFPDAKSCPYCKTPMMKVVDEIGQNHYLCQRLSCSYEEMEIKKRVLVPKKEAKSEPPVQKVVVKPKSVAPADGVKKRVVLKKKSPQANFSLKDDEEPTYTWETVIEVVRPSKLSYRREIRPKAGKDAWNAGLQSNHVVEEIPSSGGSFAELLQASEARKHRDREKKRK
jgi:DNA topoisomerase-3